MPTIKRQGDRCSELRSILTTSFRDDFLRRDSRPTSLKILQVGLVGLHVNK